MAESIPTIAPIAATIPPIVTAQTVPEQTKPDAAVNNTGANETGTDTQAESKTEAQTEKTFNQEEVNRIVATRVKAAVKAELRKLAGETDGNPTVEDLQRQLSETARRAQTYEAREAIRTYLGENKLKDSLAIIELVEKRLEYADDGKPSNVKDAVNAVKSLEPSLFVSSTNSINAGQGRYAHSTPMTGEQFFRDQVARVKG